jgi:hypothetical protein
MIPLRFVTLMLLSIRAEVSALRAKAVHSERFEGWRRPSARHGGAFRSAAFERSRCAGIQRVNGDKEVDDLLRYFNLKGQLGGEIGGVLVRGFCDDCVRVGLDFRRNSALTL